MNNPKLVAVAQTMFYGALFAIIPTVVTNLGAGGAFYGVLPVGITGIVIAVLNYIENQIQQKTGNAMFGTIA